MKSLAHILGSGRLLRAVGVDDAPFDRDHRGGPVKLAGIVCSGTRIEGMLWGETTKDGRDATEVITRLIGESKFADQLHITLLDGVTVGGLNVINLPALHEALQIPVVSVMRRPPNLDRMRAVVLQLPDGHHRWGQIEQAGPVHSIGGFHFQCHGAEPDVVSRALAALTDRGKVPEPLRLAHLIGAAVMTGQSTGRA